MSVDSAHDGEEPVRNRILSDTDFKLILMTLNAWKVYTRANKGIKKDSLFVTSLHKYY